MKLLTDPGCLKGMKVTVMGLGLNGGGLASCKFLLQHGADVTVTDLRSEVELRPSLEALEGFEFRLVLGRHELEDFSGADFVIKNPAVRPGNPFVAASQRIETDLSLFFAFSHNPILGVTGSKGKSSTASALHHCLKLAWPNARLGGNITVSPLSFIHELQPDTPVVLELSSFQLGDLYLTGSFKEGSLRSFPPQIGILTNIYRDHQDYYGAMEPYVEDKIKLFATQEHGQHTLLFVDDAWTDRISTRCPGHKVYLSGNGNGTGIDAWLAPPSGTYPDAFTGPLGWIRKGGQNVQIVPEHLSLAGQHHRKNLLAAGTAAVLFGMDPLQVRQGIAAFAGVEHRLETVAIHQGITFINDSAATIPDAVLAGVSSLGGTIHLITGGTDKKLEFHDFLTIRSQVKSMRLLKGTATDAIAALLEREGREHQGIYDNLELCVRDCIAQARPGDTILLSPGCASFGLFLNEFDRGRKYKTAVLSCIAGK